MLEHLILLIFPLICDTIFAKISTKQMCFYYNHDYACDDSPGIKKLKDRVEY